ASIASGPAPEARRPRRTPGRDAPMTMLGLRYDLRAPAFAGVTHAELYAACLDQWAWAEAGGFDVVAISEHHGVDDGYLSAPVTLAAAIAGRTKRLQINIAAVLVPLHDPVRLAEQLAVVQLVSGGRLSLVAGMGYRDEEVQMAGVDRRQRGRLPQEDVRLVRQARGRQPLPARGAGGAGAGVAADGADRRLDGEGGTPGRAAARRVLSRHRGRRARRRLRERVRTPGVHRLRRHAGRSGVRPRQQRSRARLGAH